MLLKQTLLLTLILLNSFTISAQDISAIDALYAKRGEDLKFAIEAAEQYSELEKQTENKRLKSFLNSKVGLAWFFVGDRSESKEEQLFYFEKSHQVGFEAIKNIVTDPDTINKDELDEEEKDLLAEALYIYGIGLSKWAQTMHFTKIVKEWPKVRNSMEQIRKIDRSESNSYGALRTLGIANTKMPSPLGSKKDAMFFLKTAFTKTLTRFNISSHSYNNLAYAEILFHFKQNQEACNILQIQANLTEEDIKELDPTRIPETTKEVDLAYQMFIKENC